MSRGVAPRVRFLLRVREERLGGGTGASARTIGQRTATVWLADDRLPESPLSVVRTSRLTLSFVRVSYIQPARLCRSYPVNCERGRNGDRRIPRLAKGNGGES